MGDCSLISEKANNHDLQTQSDALFRWWTDLAAQEIEAHTGQAFSSADRPGQLSEPQLVARKDLAKKCKAAGKETHLGCLMVLKRALQNLRSHLWQQKEWRIVPKLMENIGRALVKARSTVPR